MRTKRILSLMIALMLAFTFVACGNKEIVNETTEGNVETEESEVAEVETETAGSVGEVALDEFEQTLDCLAKNNYRLPTDFNVLSIDSDFLAEIYNHVLDAVKNLDADAIKPFVDSGTYETCTEYFEVIKNNKEQLDIWNKTIGLMDYYSDADLLVAKDLSFVQSSWYTDCALENKELSIGSLSELGKEDLIDIYNNYYKSAPMTAGVNASKVININDDNYIKVLVNDIFECVGYNELYDLIGVYSGKGLDYSKVILGDCSGLSLGYGYIYSDLPCVDSLINGELTELIELTASIDDKYKGTLEYSYFEKYFLDENNLADIISFLHNECYTLRDISTLYIYMPCVNTEYPLNLINDGKEIDKLSSSGYNIMHCETIRSYPDRFNISFSAFVKLIDTMKDKGYFAE